LNVLLIGNTSLSIEKDNQINFDQPFELGQWLVTPTLNTISLLNENKVINNISSADQQEVIRKLTPKVMALFVYLAKNNGHPVSQTDIAEIIWPDRIISDSSIYQAIAQLRKALNHQDKVDYIERVSGKGYRLLVKVIQSSDTNASQQMAKAVTNVNVAIPQSTKLAIFAKYRMFTSLLLILFLTVISGVWYYFVITQETENDVLTIAVLPTQNLTQPNVESLNSFNQLLLSDLVSLPKLKFIYLRENIDSVNATLRLSTTVQQHKNLLLATVQLINQKDNDILWAQNFEVSKSELLFLKNSVVTALIAHLLPDNPMNNREVNINLDPHYESYALARYLWDKRELTSLNKAQTLFQSILVESPDHLGALIGLCHTYIYLSVYGELASSQAQLKCQPLVAQALASNIDDGEVMATQALLFMQQGKMKEAGQLINKAVIAAPNYAMGHHWRGNYLRQIGQYQQALLADQNAYSLDPLSPIIIRGLAYSYLNMRELKQASKYYQRALTIEPHYSLRALEELDFLPLNQTRAQAFMQWVQGQPTNIVNQPVYKLTQALVWLGLGKVDKAQRLITGISENEVNPGYLLYAQAALASAKGEQELVLQKLTLRRELAPDITRYAMPYIAALKHSGLSDKALLQFRHYFPEITLNTEITSEKIAQFIFLGLLLDDNKKSKAKKQIVAKINDYLALETNQLNDRDKIYWYALIEQQHRVKQTIESQFKSDWLPDYNDNMFSEIDFRTMYLKSGGSAYQWQKLLQNNRSIE